MESTLISSSIAADPSLPFSPTEMRLLANRYRVVRVLKRDPIAEQLLATDTSTGRAVVVRCFALADLSPGKRRCLEREAEALRKLESPWMGSPPEITREGDRLLVAQPYLAGLTLRQRLLRGPLDVRDALTLGRCLFSLLKEAHAHRILHHDIRPDNIIVADETPLTGAVLINFSLSCHAAPGTSTDRESMAAARYCSPERSGTAASEAGETSDLYSAGIVLFESLTGQLPFHGNAGGALQLEHAATDVPQLRSQGCDVPRAVDELVQRLLRKDPRDRYQSARAVLSDLDWITASLQGRAADSTFVVGFRDCRPTLTEPAFVGRRLELDRLETQIRAAAEGQAGLVLLEAQSGGGKSRLLEEVALRGVQAGMWVVRGARLQLASQTPLQLLDGLVEHLAAAARCDPSLAQALHDRLGDHADAVAAVLPELARELGWKRPAALGPEAFAETRNIQALAALLNALGSETRPALVLLDDCQWADEMTVKLVAHWQSSQIGPAAKGRHTLVVAAFRSEQVDADHQFRKLHPALHLRLSPLRSGELQSLLGSMAGPLPSEAVEVVSQLSEGSPFMASAVLRGMVESGALTPGVAGWSIEPLALADLQSSSLAAGFLSHRIDLLSPDTISLLTVSAVVGRQFDVDLVGPLARLPIARTLYALDEARARHFVWIQQDKAKCLFVHDKIREALLERLDPADRRELHQSIARHLQREDPGQIFDLAYHFDAGGDHAAALPYALQAAEQARAQHALEIAEKQYRIAQRAATSADKATRCRIAEGLGDVLMLRGRYDAAENLFKAALGLAEGTLAEAQICGKLGELDLKRGEMERAAQAFEDALRLLGKPLPSHPLTRAIALALEVAIQAVHTLFPRWFVSRHARKPSRAELLCLHLLSRLARAYWYTPKRMIGFCAHLRSMNLAERYAPTLDMAQIYSEHAVAMTLLGWYGRGLTYAKRSLEICRAMGDLWGQGQALSFAGCVLYAASRYRDCLEKCRAAVRLLRRTGDHWEMHIAHYQIAASLYRLGDLRGALHEARRLHRSGVQVGDEHALGISLDVWSLATAGMVPEEILDREVNRRRSDALAKVQVLVACGAQLSAGSQHEKAVAVLERAVEEDERLGLLNAYVAPAFVWLATALRRQAECQGGLALGKGPLLLARAEAVARRAVRVARRFQNDLPHALREYAIIRALRGKKAGLRPLLQQSLEVARRQTARYEYAQTLFSYGQLGLALGWPNADTQIRDAEALLHELAISAASAGAPPSDAPASLSPLDRPDRGLNAGRKLASTLNHSACTSLNN